ncbi:hypothetical protein KBZ94_19785 [Streptomyces sp. RM72]|uniref:hypothetical protein n=1 Tax=Streptomyces sp. RM72 TaxID=1115510 RepID=UPI001B369082|nr:hypothetical protein [Streptomyces sp. RM72]MBQ0887150.1 hypothetical protein [Streptomyces sp. RM72]
MDRLMAGMLEAGGMFREVTATQVLLSTASPRIRFVELTADEEKENGADWLWWWVDRDGTCYGLLVQAKILKLHGKHWSIDFSYKTRGDDRTQLSKLIKAVNRFHVPAAYVLYCGDTRYRSTLACDRTHDDVPCKERDRVGVSTVSALVAENAVGLDAKNAGVSAFHDAVPVEDVASPDGLDAPIVPLARGLDQDLERFLRQPQRARAGWQSNFSGLSSGSGTASSRARRSWNAPPRSPAPFSRTSPTTMGIFSVPYLAHMLRGLRAEVPDYVRDVLEGRIPPAWVTDHVGGIVVIPDADAPITASPARAGDGGAGLLPSDFLEAPQPPHDHRPGHAA